MDNITGRWLLLRRKMLRDIFDILKNLDPKLCIMNAPDIFFLHVCLYMSTFKVVRDQFKQ